MKGSSRNPSGREEDSSQRFLPNTPHTYDTTSATEEAGQDPGAEKPSSETVDVDAILDKAVAVRGQPLTWRTSVVDLMKTLKLDSSLGARVAEVRSGTEVRTSNRWTGPAGSGAGSPRRMVFKNRFEP